MFNVGDIVKLKNGLKIGLRYGDLTYWSSMSNYANKPLKIINIINEANYGVENCCYIFSEEMLELYNEKLINSSITHNFKIGDTVVIRNDLIPNNLYQNIAFVDDMSKYKGHTFKIENIISYLPNTYNLINDYAEEYLFSEEMFEPQSQIETSKYSISKQINEINKDINSNKITITEVIINPCKKEIYTL